MPRHTFRRLRQLRIEVAMGWSVKGHALKLAIWMALIGVDEPSKANHVSTKSLYTRDRKTTHRYPWAE